MSRLIVFDTETTGTDKTKHDIVTMAGRIYVNDVFRRKFYIKCQPVSWENIEQSALDVNKITISELKTFPKAEQAADQLNKELLAEWEGDEDRFKIVAHNAEFDVGFLHEFFYKANRPAMIRFVEWKTYIDTLELARYLRARGLIQAYSLKILSLAKALGIVVVKGNLHNAEYDVQILDEIFWRMEKILKMPNQDVSTTSGNQLTMF